MATRPRSADVGNAQFVRQYDGARWPNKQIAGRFSDRGVDGRARGRWIIAAKL
jgi:hypothetical protein